MMIVYFFSITCRGGIEAVRVLALQTEAFDRFVTNRTNSVLLRLQEEVAAASETEGMVAGLDAAERLELRVVGGSALSA